MAATLGRLSVPSLMRRSPRLSAAMKNCPLAATELPTDGQGNCPLVAMRSAHFHF